MVEQKRKTTRLKELFERPEIFVLAGGTNPLFAQLAETAGFEAFYMSGGNTSAHLLGWPDVGVTTMREMVDNAHRIAMAIDIPVFSDADTGYGNAIQVYRTVKEFIAAGVAGIHLEDQESPKKSGSMAGRRCIEVAEMVGKLRAAMDAKMEWDPDFVICARCDFRGAEGGSFAGAIERCILYKEEAGVDLVFPEGLQTWEEVQEACRRIPGPVLPLLHPTVIQPFPSLEAQEAAGCAAAFFPSLTTMAALQASWDFLHDFKARGTQALDEFRERAAQSPWGEITNNQVTKLRRIREMEEKYLPQTLQRDYENTLGIRPQ